MHQLYATETLTGLLIVIAAFFYGRWAGGKRG